MSSNHPPDTERRLRAALAAAGLPRAARPLRGGRGVWRVQTGRRDMAVKLYEGPAAGERLRTEFAVLCQLEALGAPVPAAVAAVPEALALVRAWAPGAPLLHHLRADDWPVDLLAAVRRSWTVLTERLTRWRARMPAARLASARTKRTREVRAVAQAVAAAYPRLPRTALSDLERSVVSGPFGLAPLDASAGNVIVDERGAAVFIDLELLGLDFLDWTFAKYVTVAASGGGAAPVRSLVGGAAAAPADAHVDAAVTLLTLARAAGLWGTPRIPPHAAAASLPGASAAARRIRTALA